MVATHFVFTGNGRKANKLLLLFKDVTDLGIEVIRIGGCCSSYKQKKKLLKNERSNY
jgi:hypothetical protein